MYISSMTNGDVSFFKHNSKRRWQTLEIETKIVGDEVKCRVNLEAELAEEPLVLAELVSLLELVLDLFARLLPEGGVAEAVLVDDRLVHHDVDRVTSRHHVVEVDHLHERLDLAALRHLLLAHLLGHLQWVSGG